MVEWSRFYDAFWSMFGVRGEWLYVRPEARGLGVAAALVAALCAHGRREGAEFLRAGAYTDDVARLYERCAIGGPSWECHVSAEAFHVLADLGGKPVREIVRGLPAKELGKVPARPRG
jgi:GNAT superfamily N-acetyltransferase